MLILATGDVVKFNIYVAQTPLMLEQAIGILITNNEMYMLQRLQS